MDLKEIKEMVSDPDTLTHEFAYDFYKRWVPWLIGRIEELEEDNEALRQGVEYVGS